MKSIRRLYFYLVAFISIEVIVWGLIGLLRSIVDRTVSGGADALAQALALILVGVPIFLIHWLWAQRAAARDDEEKTASLRAVFLYVILLATLIPVAPATSPIAMEVGIMPSRNAAASSAVSGAGAAG